MTRSGSKRAAMAPLERHEDSRGALYWRVKRSVEAGVPLAAVAREPDMPTRATLERWLVNDDAMRARHVAALERQRLVLAEEFVVAADAEAMRARGRRRVAALRTQIAARTRLLRLLADSEKKAASASGEAGATTRAGAVSKPKPGPANDDRPDRVAPRPSEQPACGISDEGIAILEAACARQTAPTANDDATGPDPSSASSSSLSSSSPKGEDPRVSFAAKTKTHGPSFIDGRANARPKAASADHDEREDTPSPATPANDSADDEPAYAPEDARYRPRRVDDEPPAAAAANDDSDDEPAYAPEDARYRPRRANESAAPKTPPDPSASPATPAAPRPDEKKSPWKPDTPTTVRFDTGGADVSNQRESSSGMADYDPFE